MIDFLTWSTDLHLDQHPDKESFIKELAEKSPHGLIVSGDISTGTNILEDLELLIRHLNAPLYFVLGNHDYYQRNIKELRKEVDAFSKKRPNITFLTTSGILHIDNSTALVGHDGWADGCSGNFLHFFNNSVELMDYTQVLDFIGLNRNLLLQKLSSLAKEAIDHFSILLPKAFLQYDHVICVIHPPPFREACLYEGYVTNDDWAPHFVSEALGKFFINTMREWKDKKLTVLCGHAHHWADISPLPQLRVITGNARQIIPINQNLLFSNEMICSISPEVL